MTSLSVRTIVCYADGAGRSRDRLCWRATCQGIPRIGSSRRCVTDGELSCSSSPHTHRIESRQCLKKRKKKTVWTPHAHYLNFFGKSPIPAEPTQFLIDGNCTVDATSSGKSPGRSIVPYFQTTATYKKEKFWYVVHFTISKMAAPYCFLRHGPSVVMVARSSSVYGPFCAISSNALRPRTTSDSTPRSRATSLRHDINAA